MPNFAPVVSRACVAFTAMTCLVLIANRPANAQEAGTTFFVTSTGIGNGANLGGIGGADNHCQELAQAAGATASGVKTWHAYLSTQAADGKPAINARDRIGNGAGHPARLAS